MNFYDETKGNIYAYELNGTETFVAEMDPKAKTWEIVNQNSITLQCIIIVDFSIHKSNSSSSLGDMVIAVLQYFHNL
jgi:hypothetical protein